MHCDEAMRLLSSMLFVGLLGGLAGAAPKTSLRVVRVMPETHEALMFDKAHGKHVVVEEGKEIDGFRVDEVDDDTVTLTAIDGGGQVVLAGPDPSWHRHHDQAAKAKPAVTDAAMPQDPYASSSAAPQDPYADAPLDAVRAVAAPIRAGEGGVRTVEAPAADAKPVRTVEAPGSKSDLETKAAELGLRPIEAAPLSLPPAKAVTAPSTENATPAKAVTAPATENATPAPVAPAPAVVVEPAPTPADLDNSAWGGLPADAAPAPAPVKAAPVKVAPAASPAMPVDGPTIIARAEVNAALANFGALAGSVHGGFTTTGARLDTIAPDSILAKAGLQSGDTITAINGQPLRTIDDAASLYSRARGMKAATVEILRNGKPMTLRLQIQ